MPVITRTSRTPATDQELKNRLVAEWKDQDPKEPRPMIVQETDDSGVVVHVYVVWSEWGDLDQQARSEIITEAYWEAFDVKGLALTVAMGLTPEEAKRMNLPTG